MRYLLILGVLVLCSSQIEATSNRCDEPRAVVHSTLCTSCAAAPAIVCPPGFRRTSTDAVCRHTVQIGERLLELPGCSRSCEKTTTVKRCCPDFFGPLCLPCPSWSGKVCNWHGTCMDGESGNGTCVCEAGFTGTACQKCSNGNAYGEHCSSVCSCVHGECNSGPDGDGKCYCQPPYSGPKCDKVTSSCSNCTLFSYCKGEGESAQCMCHPHYRKAGLICVGVCNTNDCDKNAGCSYKGAGKFECKCKAGYEGDGKFCLPINPCAQNNGGCPNASTICEYTGPGQSKCVCLSGMEARDPRDGCTFKSACKKNPCHRSAQCETAQDGTARCVCRLGQISDGRRCYGNIMERVLELDREGSQMGNLSGSISLFEKGCELILSQRGPFTAFIPVDTSQVTLNILNQFSAESICKQHLILGQHLYRELEGQDFWTYQGDAIRFKVNKQFILKRDPDTVFRIIQSDIPAANGIIHIVDKAITFDTTDVSDSTQFSTKSIGDILAEDTRFNRFISLVDNCGAPMPLRDEGPFTVFVPTNKAVDKARDGSIIYMLTEAKHKLQELVRYHIFSQAAVTVDQLASMAEIQTMANQVITINASGDGRVLLTDKGIPLDVKDIVASNGIIHVIDGLLLPPSIVPIMPHRCDVNESTIVMSPCVHCRYITESRCPTGSEEVPDRVHSCEPLPDPRWNDFVTVPGCAKYCRLTRMRAECCKGFYGPDCKPCIGGFQHPCYDKGTCADGITGDGSCKCNPGFMGIGCHICSDTNKHGEKCEEDCRCLHGVCDNRPGSQGVCRRDSCFFGFSGDLCDQVITRCHADEIFEHCHIHAYCTRTDNGNLCVCSPGYEGDGYSCTEANMCLKPDRGGCNVNAQCVYAGPGNVSCVCNEGWTGDGMLCVEINNCLLEDRGGCHVDADCTPIGPGQSECICKKGFMGDGFMCQIVNPCRTENGGCHALASCSFINGTRKCTCPEGYEGDGFICYGSILMEMEGNSDFFLFNRQLEKHPVISADSNLTALIPLKDAFWNLSIGGERIWTDYYTIPYLLKAHFLDGVYSYEDLRKRLNQTIPTKSKTKWKITETDGDLRIGDASIIVRDLKAINGYIHIINKVLKPPLSDIPPPPPDLMEVLNKTSSFSLFRNAALLYNLTEIIPSRDFTIFVPHDSAVKEYLEKTNATRLDKDIVEYHVIPKEQLFPEHLSNGMLRSTLLGEAYQIMVHLSSKNETLINDVPLDGNFTEVRHGVIINIPRVLEIHKNHCSRSVFQKVLGRCSDCDSTPKCGFGAKPVTASFSLNMKSNCRYRKRVGRKRTFVQGCMVDCLKATMEHSCCPGYYGTACFKCPGKVDNWCSNNGKCQDGLSGNGECLCNEGFHGTACEMCEPGRYGKDCKSECHCGQGKCLDGMDGNGQCVCYKGWKGVNCSVEVVNDECGGICHEDANCVRPSPGDKPTCVCIAGYRGNGTSCQEIDLCAVNNGGCSEHATCTKISPGERSCTCKEDYRGDGTVCLELDPCFINNGGCSENSVCIKTGPNEAACVCKPGYVPQRRLCIAINLCIKDNGGCSPNAMCQYTGPGERNCTCRIGYKGDGVMCAGSVSRELLHQPAAAWFRKNVASSRVRDLYGKGPFTLFAPHADKVKNVTLDSWVTKERSGDLLRYHIVGCEQISASELKSVKRVVAASGHVLSFSEKDGAIYINGDAKIITSDMECSNGVIHYIDKVLVPYDLNKKPEFNESLSLITAAEAYGYTMFSKLLQKANMVEMLQNKVLFPFTMFWPTDTAFNSLPEEQKNWLYSGDHRDKLQAYLKFHMIRDQRIYASSLPGEKSVRTLYGTQLTFSCSQDLQGDIFINGNDAKIVERHLPFYMGIAHGIDKVLEPPNIGAHCDNFTITEISGRCGLCSFPPSCPYGSESTNKTNFCRKPWYPRRHSIFNDFPMQAPYGLLQTFGCNRVCKRISWVSKCCKNHYGRDCQACPGGLEAPCGQHGSCDDGVFGTGLCNCHAGFKGTACELCKLNYYGPNCTACNCINGRCQDGLDGDGSCFCQEGWTGARCASKIGVKPVCSPECDSNAVCESDNQCQCVPPYEGNGLNCTAPDLCSEYNGGCHDQADCTQTGINVTCSCKADYTGDGIVCSPINRCVEEPNGGCSDFANCIYTGPNERRCECLLGYVGNGVQCFEKVVPPVDRCLEGNGGCDAKAICKDLHFHTKTAGVYHLRSPAGKYMMNYSAAEAACKAEEATLATLTQLSNAQQLGMHLCVAGWIDGKKVGYPIRYPSPKCGDNHVGIVLYKEPIELSTTYDTYCYREREVTCECGPGYIGNGDFCNGNLASIIATQANFSIFYSTLVKYAEASEDGRNLLDFLSTGSSNTTLFVPDDTGFSANETLSWRDMEYHLSTNNSLHFYEDLKHNMVIPSRLGFNLKVLLEADNTTQDEDSPPLKLVNKRIILAWDIPATNGLIHVIQGPLRAPPVHVNPPSPSAGHSPSSAPAVTAILSLIFIIGIGAGVAYYFLKHKNDDFRFQYFKNDDEDGGSAKANPALVSIPNPLYSGYKAFAEPFGEGEQCESPATATEAAASDTPDLLG